MRGGRMAEGSRVEQSDLAHYAELLERELLLAQSQRRGALLVLLCVLLLLLGLAWLRWAVAPTWLPKELS